MITPRLIELAAIYRNNELLVEVDNRYNYRTIYPNLSKLIDWRTSYILRVKHVVKHLDF